MPFRSKIIFFYFPPIFLLTVKAPSDAELWLSHAAILKLPDTGLGFRV